MTNVDIDRFIENMRMNQENQIRVRGSKKDPTKKLSFRYSSVTHAPALEVAHGKQTDIYEFEKNFTPSGLNDLISKWILFSIRAKTLSGTFYLVVREKDKLKFTKIISEKLLDIEVLTLK